MWNKIKNLLKKLVGGPSAGYVSGVKFKEAIKALGMEAYRGITIIYLAKPSEKEAGKLQPIYHYFYKKEFKYAEADTYEELQELAKKEIDILLG